MLNVRDNVAFAYNDVWTAAEVNCAETGPGAFMQLAKCACGSCSCGVDLLDLCASFSSIPRYHLSLCICDVGEFIAEAEIPNERQPSCAGTNKEAAHAKTQVQPCRGSKVSCHSSSGDSWCCHELVSLHYKSGICILDNELLYYHTNKALAMMRAGRARVRYDEIDRKSW